MPTCFVPGCTSGYSSNKNNTDRHFFSAPKDATLRSLWNKAIPRADKELSTKSKVCDCHFHEQDIDKWYVHTINGNTVQTPRGKWSLVDGAIPSVFPNLPAYLSKPPPKKRKRREGIPGAGRKNADEGDSAQDAGCSPCFAAENVQEITVPDMKNVELPPLWHRIALEDSSGEYVAFSTVTSTHRALQIEKCVCVGGDSKASASAHGRPAKAFFNLSVHSLNDLSILLDKVDKLLICHGQQHNGGCLSPKCKVLSPQETCSSCRAQKKKLLGNALRRKERLTRKQKKMKNLQKKAMRAAAAKVAFLKEIKNLKEELTCRPTETIKEAIKSLPPIQQVAFETSLNNVKVKGPQGVRYARTWVMNCLLLRIASPKAYNLLRSMKLLPLPTCSRLNQILSGVPCEYGYNEVALDTIRAFFRDKPAVQRCGTLVLDEIKLKESVDFNKSTYKFDGFVNFSSSQGEAATVPADHALVIMFIPLFHNWVQPVASFATRGAAPGFVLAKLVLECVIELERHNALVIAVVSDGAGNNQCGNMLEYQESCTLR